MSLTREARKKWRTLAHTRWSRYAVRQIGYEHWPERLWSGLLETVTDTCTTDLLPNLSHPTASRMMESLENDFAPATMSREDEVQTAQTVTQFLSLADNDFHASDQYLQEFLVLLRAYIFAMLVKSSSRCSLIELAKRQASDDGQFDRLVEVGPVECLHFGCTTFKITRRRAVAACLKLLKPASQMKPKVYELMSWAEMDIVRLANSVLHICMFAQTIPRLRKAGILLFVSVMEGDDPENAHNLMRRARILLP